MKTKRLLERVACLLLGLAALVPSAAGFYDPTIGRWVNRDPIGELGGINNHGFVRGNPIERIDSFGRNYAGPYYVNGVIVQLGGDAGITINGQPLDPLDQNADGVVDAYEYEGGNPGLQPSILGEVILGGGAKACIPRPAFVTVCRWGRPGLQSGDWVMTGGKNWWNYTLSGKYQPASWIGRNMPAASLPDRSFSFFEVHLLIQMAFLGLPRDSLASVAIAPDMRALLAIGLLSFALLFIGANYLIAARWYLLKKSETMIPLVGGILGAAGILIMPNHNWTPVFWLPLIVDLGSAPLFVAVGLEAVKKRRSHAKDKVSRD